MFKLSGFTIGFDLLGLFHVGDEVKDTVGVSTLIVIP